MKLIKRLFGGGGPASEPSSAHSQLASGMSQQHAVTQNGTRRELLRVVLRDTLLRHGIPADWMAAEMLSTTSRSGQRGMHWRLVVRHWDPRLLTHGVAFQNALLKRVVTFDPLAPNWLDGISWRFELSDESECPPMPHPGSWTADPHEPVATAAPVAAQTGVIEGPVHIADTPQPVAGPAPDGDARADLDRLLAIRDADFREHADAESPAWKSTQPAGLGVSPPPRSP